MFRVIIIGCPGDGMEERYGIERQHDSYLSFLSHFTISFPLNSRSPSVSLFGSSTKPFCKPTPGQGAHLQDRTRKRAKKGAFASTGREDTSGYLARLSTTQSSLASWLLRAESSKWPEPPIFSRSPVMENNTRLCLHILCLVNGLHHCFVGSRMINY
jgi:hypothetical protein